MYWNTRFGDWVQHAARGTRLDATIVPDPDVAEQCTVRGIASCESLFVRSLQFLERRDRFSVKLAVREVLGSIADEANNKS